MTFLLVLLVILAALALVGLVSMAIDNRRFVVRDYTVSSAKVREDLTFVFVTDLHAKDYGNRNARVLDAIRDAKPDAILVGGDMIVSRQAREERPHWIDVAADFLEQAAAIAPVYMVNGNHEQYLVDYEGFSRQYHEWCRMAVKAGVVKLHNQAVDFTKNGRFTGVRLYGLDLDSETYRKVLPYHLPVSAVEEKIGRPAEDAAFRLLLAHNPKYFPVYAAWGADLTLSGHVHGGLLRLGRLGFIGPDLHLFPKYSGGEYTLPPQVQARGTVSGTPYDLEPSRLIVSCGLGSHTLPIRIFNPGELTVIHLHTLPGKEEQVG